MGLTSSQLLQLAQGAGFQGNDAQTMAAIIKAESRGNPNAYNPNAATGDKSYGLAQINMIGGLGPARLKQFGLKSNEQLFDPATNLRAAKQVKDSSGFGAWTTYKSGAYKQFLPEVQKSAAGLPNNLPTTQTSQQTTQPGTAANTYNIYVSEDSPNTKKLSINPANFLNDYINKSSIDPFSALMAAFNSGDRYDLS
jgi:hypothetical protein